MNRHSTLIFIFFCIITSNAGIVPFHPIGFHNVDPIHMIYMKDNWNVYFNNRKVADASVRSFQDLGFGYGKDDWNVFYLGNKMPDAKPRSFEILQPYTGYTKDTWNVYYFGKIVPDAKSHSFQSMGKGYGKDAWSMFFKGKKLN
ncbi:unnamed protein product [Rotaria sp. Silwood1]|nr:unnamed protein product [Rotaria sp. Silwood1]